MLYSIAPFIEGYYTGVERPYNTSMMNNRIMDVAREKAKEMAESLLRSRPNLTLLGYKITVNYSKENNDVVHISVMYLTENMDAIGEVSKIIIVSQPR